MIPNALGKVRNLRGVTFKSLLTGKRGTGLVAQELIEQLPEAVEQDDNGKYSVAYGNVTGLLVEAIKEQQKQIEELQALVKELINATSN